jgi:hypothetical protein
MFIVKSYEQFFAPFISDDRRITTLSKDFAYVT